MTTPTISTLLLVPAEGDPHGLLAKGPCGARPPTMERHTHKDGGSCWRGVDQCTRARLLVATPVRALVLAHEGEPVPEGCDRAARAWSTICVEEWVSGILAGRPQPQLPGGTLLALDPSGRDITAEVLGG